MNVYLSNKKKSYNARGKYDFKTNQLIVKKGSQVSADVAYSASFRGSKTIEKLRNEYTKDGFLTEDVVFNSSSTAANFVTGRSSNGLILWKNAEGKTLKALKENDV